MKRLSLIIPIVSLVLVLFAVGCSTIDKAKESAEEWADERSEPAETPTVAVTYPSQLAI